MNTNCTSHMEELAAGERFAFGDNWRSFLRGLDAARIQEAESSLRNALARADLQGCSFLDVGSGSGLFSLAAARLGAARVVSLDYDPECVACCRTLKSRYAPDDCDWTVIQGDVRCRSSMASLGRFDAVYSWGMLHQTGDMWSALDIVAGCVDAEGRLVISIYNHQPVGTPFWTVVKRFYNRTWRPIRWCMAIGYLGVKTPVLWLRDQVEKQGDSRARPTRNGRGMSIYHDAVDWVGGYPFETASPEAIFRFFRDRGYILRDLSTVGGGSGCNEYVFVKPAGTFGNSASD